MTASVDVTNTGSRAGDEVVQLYTHQRTSRDKQPLRALRGFQRVHLDPGQTRTVRLRVSADLRSGVSGFTARVAKASAGDAAIQVRLDDPASGPVVATAPVRSTGDAYTYTTTTARVTGARGLHDVYLVLTGDLRLATFSFTTGRS